MRLDTGGGLNNSMRLNNGVSDGLNNSVRGGLNNSVDGGLNNGVSDELNNGVRGGLNNSVRGGLNNSVDGRLNNGVRLKLWLNDDIRFPLSLNWSVRQWSGSDDKLRQNDLNRFGLDNERL